MSDAGGVVSNLISVDELLTPQFLYPVCGVILCAVAVFLVGVGFKSSSEPKFEISGEGDGVPFLKKKKKQKNTVPLAQTSKKTQQSAATQPKTLRNRRPDDFLEREPSLLTKRAFIDRDTNESVAAVVADEWITPVSRKEKKARRRHEVVPEKEPEVHDVSDTPVVVLEKEPEVDVTEVEVATPAPQRLASEKKQRSIRHEEPKKEAASTSIQGSVTVEKTVKEEEETKSKKSTKQKQKHQEPTSSAATSSDSHPPASQAPAPAPAATGGESSSPRATSTSTKKKRKGASAASAEAGPGAFRLAEFELPSAVVPAAVPRTSPSPPSTDSSFELVDADAVREAIEEAEEEKQVVPSKTSGASKRKNKKPTAAKVVATGAAAAGSGGISKISEESVPSGSPVAKAATPAATRVAPAAAAAAVEDTPAPVDEAPEADEWQDARSSRKRRRARRDD